MVRAWATSAAVVCGLLAACAGEAPVEEATPTPPARGAASADSSVAARGDLLPVSDPEAVEASNDRHFVLTQGYWAVETVFEREPTERYQAYRGRFYRFAPDGTYALYAPGGEPVHRGTYVLERRGNHYWFVTLDADRDQYDNEYRIHIQRRAAVMVGTESYDNPGVQMKLARLDEPPVPLG